MEKIARTSFGPFLAFSHSFSTLAKRSVSQPDWEILFLIFLWHLQVAHQIVVLSQHRVLREDLRLRGTPRCSGTDPVRCA